MVEVLKCGQIELFEAGEDVGPLLWEGLLDGRHHRAARGIGVLYRQGYAGKQRTNARMICLKITKKSSPQLRNKICLELT